MEIKACLYFSFWAVITLTFLKLGFDALDKTGLSTSVSPAVMFVFKHALAISVCHSSDHTFVQSKTLSFQDDRYHICTLILLVMHVVIGGHIIVYLHIYYIIYGIEIAYRSVLVQSVEDGIDLTADLLLKAIMMCFGRGRTKFIPMLAVLIGSYTSVVWAAITEERPYELLTVADRLRENNLTRIRTRGKLVKFGVRVVGTILLRSERQSTWRKILKDRRKFIEFAIGMMGTILFQNFFRLTSFDHVLAFLYLAVSWLGNLALFRPSGDLGVFNFLLGNVIVGCTVSQFGLRGATWIAYGASVLLYGLCLGLQNVSLVDKGRGERVIVW